MTHQNHQTNGASLEDCHTNFFALTDLCGIKWRKFVNGERPNASSDPLDDPILRSYSRCMQADILCVWRRVQSFKQDNLDPNALSYEISSSKVHPPLSLAAAKELWIFWYGEEPDLSELVDAELLKIAGNQLLWNGTWERGLTYECRSLLFKALHNLMERFVLTKDIVRFGKWFVQPCTSSDHLFGRSSQHLSFSFTFFVHGDTVCASIDLREHPAVRPLTKEHLTEAVKAFAAVASNASSSTQSHEQSSLPNEADGDRRGGDSCGTSTAPKPRKVILAPFGMAATLTGNSYKASDPMAEKILEDWASFFPLCNKDNSDVPPVVEVVSGGHKMYHPSIYVLVTDLDDMEEMEAAAAASQKGFLGASSSAEAAALAALSATNSNDNVNRKAAEVMPTIASSLSPSFTFNAVKTTTQVDRQNGAGRGVDRNHTKVQPYYDTLTSSFTCNTTNTHAPPQAATEMPERAWQDCITNTLHVAFSAASASSGDGDDSGSIENVNNNNNNINTHAVDISPRVPLPQQQQTQPQKEQPWGFIDPTQKAPCICTKSLPTAATTPHGTPHGGASTYSRNSIGDSMPVPSVGSPGTPAASPHPNSTLSQPTSVPPADQLLNMSPRAPASVQQPSTPIDHLLDKNTPAPTPTDQHDSKSITASPYVHPAHSVEPPPSAEGMHGSGMGPGSVPPPSVGGGGRCTPTIGQQQQAALLIPQQCGTISVKKFEVMHHSLTSLDAADIKLEHGVDSLPNNNCKRPSIAASEVMHDFLKLYKPPKLNVKDIDSFANDDCLKLNVLYDFTVQDAWVNHPMKRFRPNEVAKPCRSLRTKNLYDGHTHSKPLMPSPGSVYGSQLLTIDANMSNLSGVDTVGGVGCNSGGLVGIAAPGTFTNGNIAVGSDGNNLNNNMGSGFFPGLDIKTEVGTTSPCKEAKVGGNLFTAEGLNPSLNDLEQLFETSSNDECGSVQIHTPPDSNNPSNGCAATNTIDDLNRTTAVASAVAVAAAAAGNNVGASALAVLQNCTGGLTASNNNNNNISSGANSIQAEDLTKMFPTPPSHEQHHPNSSPCQMDLQMTDLSVMTTTTTTTTSLSTTAIDGSGLGVSSIIKIKQEYSVELGSPVDEPIEDWSYVYRPPQQAKFVGSSKYAPLTNLPSQTLPPLAVPSNCVYKPSWKTQKSRAAAAAQAAAVQQQQQHMHQQQQQQQHQQHQQLHELLSAAPRTPLQQPRTPLGPMPSPHTVPPPLNSGSGSNLLLTQLNCPQAALTNTAATVGGPPTMQQLMQRAGMSPISPAAPSVPFPRGSPMLQQRQTPIHPPPPYDMAVASPATSTTSSSYLNKQYNSQEPPQTPHSVGMPGMHAGRPHSSAGGHIASASGALCAVSSAARELPEVSSVMVNILLYDTALNVFRDHNFDSSTVCVCNADSQKVGNIRGADSGVYVPLPGNTFNPTQAPASSGIGGGSASLRMISAFGGGAGGCSGGVGSALDSPAGSGGHHTGGSNSSSSNTPAASNSNQQQHITGYVDDDPVDCTCGFSAVVNRRLAYHAGLFYEDEMEITGMAEDPGRHKKLSLLALITSLSSALGGEAASKSISNALVASNTVENNPMSLDQQAHAIFDLLLDQCSTIQTSSSSIHRALHRHRRRLSKQHKQPKSIATIANVLEFVDADDIICLALEQARLAYESHRMDVNDFAQQHQLSPFHPASSAAATTTLIGRRHAASLAFGKLSVHKWPYIPVGFTRSNKDIVRTMNSIQPMLQNAFHTKSRSAAGVKDATYTVSGPLTWRQFHRLAGRASGQCEPQPIPSVIVGHDKDWISVAPLAIHYWDKFLLEPYSYARDVVYLVICPDNDHVLTETKTYFKELSSTYEMCKLGRHTPMRGWDGLLTVGTSMRTTQENASTPLDEWLRTLEDKTLANKIRLYANAFQNMLAPYLNRIPGDKTLLDPPESTGGNGTSNGNITGRDRCNTSPSSGSGVNSAIDAVTEKSHISPKLESGITSEQSVGGGGGGIGVISGSVENNTADIKPDLKAAADAKPALVLGDPLGMGDTMEEINPSAIVLYVVEPFTFGSDSPELERLACIALLRCYAELLKSIPDSVRPNMNIQIISLESILELGRTRNRKRFSDEIKCLALNIFSQCRRHMVHAQSVKSLTGFGTAANMEVFLKSKDEKNRQAYKMYTPAYILAPVHEKNEKTDFSRTSSSMRGPNEQKYSVLYCNYCMSEDQSWLLATVTDDRGEMLEKVCINIDVPNRTRRRKAPARRIGLKKLMDFIMGIISQTSQPWRLVFGRIGRIGHSELKSWSYLLSKQNLQKASKQLKDICKQCTLMYPPSILSACLVTLEPDAKLRVMPDQFTPDERFSQISMQNPLSTPQDVTCTHILVFPTSAVCLSFTRQFQNETQVDLENDFLNFDESEVENDDFNDDVLMSDILGWEQPIGRLSNHGSPDRMEDNRSWQSASGNNFNSTQQQDVEEVGSINQQPLAVGYMVSTAPTGRMPSWFWTACPHLEDVCPVFLKTALHLHVPNIQTTDDILNSTNAHSSATDHPLDSTLTADVLRYVLEGYNALSWLALDSNTHDRLSCLPINVQTLMDLYYLTAAIA